jgi:ribose transport system substrate-binding protein
MRASAARDGIELLVQSAEFDVGTQTAQIENFITQKVDAIVVCPADSQAIGGAIQQANAAHIPVFTADIRADQGEITSHIASDNLQGGQLVAEALAQALGGKGKVAIIDHPEVTSSQDRVKGFVEAMKKFPDIQIVATQSGSGVRERAATTMENLLQMHPDLKGVFGINDNTALGAISVLEGHGRKDILVVGFDADPEGREAIAKGSLYADAVQFPDQIGDATIRTVVQHLHGVTVPKLIPVPTRLLDKAGLAAR